MKRKAVLGKVAPESYKDFLDAVEASAQLLEKLGNQELEGLTQDAEPRWHGYKLMNGLGLHYGAALARAYTEHIQPDDPDLPDTIAKVIEHLALAYNEVEGRRSLRDETMVRQAVQELPHLVPAWLDVDVVIAAAQASYEGRGVYLNDFYYSITQALSDFERAFRVFLLNEKRPESMVFRREAAGGEFIPKALLDLDEGEEREFLKNVIRESNKKISERGFYGVRQEPLPPTGDFTILYWSNGAEAWMVDNHTEGAMIVRGRGTRSIQLDANMVLVPFHQVFVQKVVAGLNDLPLYVYSVEAKERGDYPEPTAHNALKAVRSIVEAQNPDLDYEEHALLAAERFDLLVRARRHEYGAGALVHAWFQLQPVNLLPFLQVIERWMKRR